MIVREFRSYEEFLQAQKIVKSVGKIWLGGSYVEDSGMVDGWKWSSDNSEIDMRLYWANGEPSINSDSYAVVMSSNGFEAHSKTETYGVALICQD